MGNHNKKEPLIKRDSSLESGRLSCRAPGRKRCLRPSNTRLSASSCRRRGITQNYQKNILGYIYNVRNGREMVARMIAIESYSTQ